MFPLPSIKMAKKQNTAQSNAENTDYDNPWKSMIELYFRDFLQFFFPAIEADIDWSKPIRFLDKELQKVVRDAEIPKRYADKLVEVHRLSGQKALVICHIEVQSQEEGNFGARMYGYNYRLRDRYDCAVVSLAILADDSKTWRPHSFQDELWGCSTHFEFPAVKLLDYQSDWSALETSRNPFAVVVMAHLKTKASHNKPADREHWKYHLTTMLYDQGYSQQDILELHNFLDWMMDLPAEFEQRFQTKLKAFEEARQMKYVTSIERMAEARGEERGRGEERLTTQTTIALNMLHKNMSPETIAEVTGLTLAQLQDLQPQANP
jgi:hypothetical protein